MIELFNWGAMRILTIFSLSPGARLNRKTIKEMSGIPNVILDRTLAKLINLKILVKEKNFLILNLGNEETGKIVSLCSELYAKFKYLSLKEYFMILNIKDEISKIKDIGDVYLFGSYSKLTFREDSDIDFAIVSDDVKTAEIKKVVRKLEKKYGKTIEVHQFSRKFYNNKRDALVKEILQHGVRMI